MWSKYNERIKANIRNMKKIVVGLMCFLASMSAFAQMKEGFKKSESGVWFKVEESNPAGRMVKEGDIVIGGYAVSYGDSLLFSSLNTPPQPTFGAMEGNRAFKGDLIDGLFLMREKETYTFAFPYDSIAKVQQVPPFFKKGDFAYYTVKVAGLMTVEEFEAEQRKAAEARRHVEDSLSAVEMQNLKSYAEENGFGNLRENGVYYKQISQGNGNKPQQGDKVRVHYVGKFLNGKVFDTSVKEEAEKAGKYMEQRSYEPLEFTIGKGQMIKGFEEAVKLMSQGEKGIVVMPSSLGYGNRQRGEIPAYSPLVFELELVEIIKDKQ